MKHIKFLVLAITGFIFTSCNTDEFLNPVPDIVFTV